MTFNKRELLFIDSHSNLIDGYSDMTYTDVRQAITNYFNWDNDKLLTLIHYFKYGSQAFILRDSSSWGVELHLSGIFPNNTNRTIVSGIRIKDSPGWGKPAPLVTEGEVRQGLLKTLNSVGIPDDIAKEISTNCKIASDVQLFKGF